MSFYLHFKHFPLMLLIAEKIFSSVYFCGGVYFIFNLETCTQWVRIYGFSFVAFLRAYKCHQPFAGSHRFWLGVCFHTKGSIVWTFFCIFFLLLAYCFTFWFSDVWIQCVCVYDAGFLFFMFVICWFCPVCSLIFFDKFWDLCWSLFSVLESTFVFTCFSCFKFPAEIPH